MKGYNTFIIKPNKGVDYDCERNGIILSSNLEDYRFTNRIGIVEGIPVDYKGNIEIGDYVVVGHNTFRTYYDMKGRKRHSSNYLFKGMYTVEIEGIYLHKKGLDDEWFGVGEFCIIKPIKNNSKWSSERYIDVVGEVLVLNNDLLQNNIKIGDVVAFKEGSEYEFLLNEESTYMVRSKNIFCVEDEELV